jgi:hypothetical protein
MVQGGARPNGALMTENDSRILMAQDRIVRQRELIAVLEARHQDTSAAKSLLSAMQYSSRAARASASRPATQICARVLQWFSAHEPNATTALAASVEQGRTVRFTAFSK